MYSTSCSSRIARSLALLSLVSATQGAAVTFDGLGVGTTYGSPTYSPGDPIFTEDGIVVSVEDFFYSSGASTFSGPAEVFAFGDMPPYGFPFAPNLGSGRFMGTPNISLGFDFSGLGFVVDHLTAEFANGGGNENISVNNQPIWFDQIMTAPAAIAPGVILSASYDPLTLLGTIELTGVIDAFRIGGQEFAVDNIAVTPEPASVMLLAMGGVLLLRRRRR